MDVLQETICVAQALTQRKEHALFVADSRLALPCQPELVQNFRVGYWRVNLAARESTVQRAAKFGCRPLGIRG